MADFKRRRKQNRQQKVSNDTESNDVPSHKRQRRGVSVFQRQLYKRKMWVKEYEAGKDQKRRDKRKVMRGYYRALKELDREHKQIFGNSISTRSRKRAKKNGNYNDYLNQTQHKNDLRYKQKDVWNELKNPSYQQKYRNSNWSFMDDAKYNKDNNNNNNNNNNNYYKPNKLYRGNGNINFGNNNNQKRKFIGGKRLNSYQRAAIEAKKIMDEKKQIQKEKELKQEERRKALDRFEKQRKRRNKILSMKNKKGQPNLNAQISLLLDKIKDNQNKSKQEKLNESVITEQQIQHQQNEYIFDSDNESEDVNDFLED